MKKTMDTQGFDAWASKYDLSVEESEAAHRYPFAAYTEILYEVYQQASKTSGVKILDLGFGTGKLSKVFYDEGYSVTGIDFSSKMKEIAKKKVPDARLLVHDFSKSLPNEVLNESFDCVICTYAIHHLTDQEQITLIDKILTLTDLVLIGDVMTRTEHEMRDLSAKESEIWDSSECYVIAENLTASLPEYKYQFIKKSYCSGVLKITK